MRKFLQINNKGRFSNFDFVCMGLGLLAFIFYYGEVWKNSFNIPRWDDYNVFFGWLKEYLDSQSVGEKFKLLFAPHGETEHIMAPMRLIVLCNYYLSGTVNLLPVIVIGNLFWIGIAAMFCLYIKSKKEMPVFVLFVILLMFNGQNLETCTWAISSIVNISPIFFGMMSILLIFSNKTRLMYILGLIIAVITVFSNGNGLCIIPAIAVGLWSQGRSKEALIVSSVLVLAGVGYFLSMNTSVGTKMVFFELLRNPVKPLVSFFSFVGAIFYIPSKQWIPVLVGLFVVGTYVYGIIREYHINNPLWFSFFTFMLCTAALVAIGRPSGMIAPLRYRTYISMFPILTLLFFFDYRDNMIIRKVVRYILPVPVLLYSVFCTFLYAQKAEKRTEYLKLSTLNWQLHGNGLFHGSTNSGTAELSWAEASGIYKMPVMPFSQLDYPICNNAIFSDKNSQIKYNISSIEENNGYYIIKGFAYIEHANMDFTDIYLYLISPTDTIRLKPFAERHYDLLEPSESLSSRSLSICENSGFCAILNKPDIPCGTYSLGIEICKRMIVPLNRTYSITTDTLFYF
ncbi:MAG: hypothetical protein LBR51_05020 [Bacteroidales bacterium]|jgi:hypothetical protein|nr:hypothetical protein [Bacteroidales bacterium]